MFGIQVITEPTVEPLSVPDLAEQLRYPHDSENLFIESLIIAARRFCERKTGRAFIQQELRLTLDRFPAGRCEIRLPRPPLIHLTASVLPDTDWPDLGIHYTDTNGDEQTVDPATYVVDSSTAVGRIGLADGEEWPTDAIEQIAAVRVQYLAGYGDTAADVPPEIKQAMKMLIGHWFTHREAVITGAISKDIEFALDALLEGAWAGSLVGTFG